MFNLAEVLEIPSSTLVIVIGPPGAGKSTFLRRTIAYNAFDLKKPTIVISTKSLPEQFERDLLKRMGAGRVGEVPVRFVDAYSGTVGLHSEGSRALGANCNDPTSIGIALAKALRDLAQESLVAVESLTPIYLLNERILIKFVQNTLLRHAGEGRRVVTVMDEGIGRAEDLNRLLALAPAVLRINLEGSNRVLEVMKHPSLERGKLIFGTIGRENKPLQCRSELTQDTEMLGAHWESHAGKSPGFIRAKLGDFVGIPWIQLVYLGGITWDTRRFPRLVYDASRDLYNHCLTLGRKDWESGEVIASIHNTEFARQFILASNGPDARERQNWALADFVSTQSSKDGYIVRLREAATCWNLNKIGAPLCFYDSGVFAGGAQAFDSDGCDWHAYEEECVGEGAPYCEIVLKPEPTTDFDKYLNAGNGSKCEEAMDSLVGTLTQVALDRAEPPSRPTLGPDARLAAFQESTSVPAISDEEFMIAVRLAGANVGKKLGESFLEAGIKLTENSKYLAALFSKLKIGRLFTTDTLKLYESCESYGIRANRPICFFTTGFLNGFYSIVNGLSVKELKCVGAGAQYCEWEFH